MTIASTYASGLLTRSTWSAPSPDGRQMLCLWTAFAEDPESRPAQCRADQCPEWLAYLLPWIDDAGTADRWDEHVRRVVALEPHLSRLGRTAEARVLGLCTVHAMRYCGDPGGVCTRVVALCQRSALGNEPTSDEWAREAREARDAAESESWAAAKSWAAKSWAKSWAESWAASAAAWAARAASAPRAAEAAAWAARAASAPRAAEAEAADDLIADILCALETEVAP